MQTKHLNTSARNAGSDSTEFPWKWRLSDLDSRPKNGRTVFSCFSCGGGSSMGYKLAGYEVIGNCEIDPDMMKIYKKNNHPKYSYLMDIRDFVNLEDIPEELKDLDVLDGSPPCSVFSMAGSRVSGGLEDGWNTEKVFREGQAKQRLDDLFFFFIDVAKRLQPKVVIAENVKGLLIGKARGYVNRIIAAFSDAGYIVQIFLFNSARMGVPQKRERVFFIAHRKDLNFSKLQITFDQVPINFSEVRERYGKPVSENSLAYRMLKWRKPADRDLADTSTRVRRKYSGFNHVYAHDDEPAPTVTSHGGACRMFDGMMMTDNDIINCQTFPQDYDFMDQNVQYVCGMSVPPVMMANIASEVEKQWFRYE